MNSKAIAIAATRENPFKPVVDSAKNFCHLAVDLMYGTPERTRVTYWFAFVLFVTGMALMANDGGAIQQACIN